MLHLSVALFFRCLPKEVVEGISSGVDFGNHLVDVVSELFYADSFFGRYEDAGGLLRRDPAVLELLEGEVDWLFWREGEFVVGFVAVGIDLIEDDELGFVAGADVAERLLHHFHLLFEAGMGDVDHMEEDIGLADFVQGALESLDQLGGKLADETHGVAEQEGDVLDNYLSHGGVQGGEEFILRKDVRFGQEVH